MSSRSRAPNLQPPGVERRRQLRDQRRKERLRNAWRLLVFSACAAALGYGLLRQGWSLRSPAQVEVLGSQQVSRDQVIRAAGLRFPVLLLSLQPRQLQDGLSATLPVEQVRVERLMLPPRLRIALVDRQAVARAERRTATGLEQGYVDRLGNWMSLGQQQVARPRDKPALEVRVVGWQERHRQTLVEILERRGRLGSPLREIRFEPNGNLLLITQSLGQVRLGPPDALLARRLDVLQHLSSQLPAQLKGRSFRSVDLSDPDQPELGQAPGATAQTSSASGDGAD
ncbi:MULTISPECIES: cell division protein FtsQ/DivIB [unclassified Synechococcus]|uniref:cell division protein FtsQ/DivIB n=1 Tax=unclassified Synechococcus TaxID=2626047 RepID=UPI0021A4F3B8|nr:MULTISPECIES: FtsQ-type POTRA domain-containing protein [unclassified Synechococcus]MCT0212924.1 FtsQ-type POTRA domain-containing protein [Synechococcus sp. CS-1326]MCT0233128.1 FtsQ-type POTRA domain-containing protein [Synechococcus sp. CS-1327]